MNVELIMENQLEARCHPREFGHCVITWEIENYGFAAHGMKYEIKSACFTVRPQMTTWKMSVTTELGLCDDKFMLFCLERMDGDMGPDAVLVNMDISILDQDGKVWSGCRGEYHFRKSDCSRVYIPNIYFGKVNEGLYNFNVMTLRCRMIVHERKKLRYTDSLDPLSSALAIDMEQLYRNMKFYDATLKCNPVPRQISAHKAILTARTKALSDKFNQDSLPYFNCLNLHYDDILQVLHYIYTANLGEILDKPSVSIYDCIRFFSLEELEEFYVADEQKLKSTIDVHQTGLMWTIENFSEKSEELMLSQMISCDSVEMAWQLRLYPRGTGRKEEFLTIIAENMQGKIDGNLWAKVELFHDPYDRSWQSMNVVKEGELFELRKFAERKDVFGKLEKGALKICFKVCASTGEVHLFDDQLVKPIPCRLSHDSYSMKLLREISSLRGDTRYADITVVAQGKEFKAHKCILGVRSSLFREMLDELEEDKMYFDNIRPEIFEIILDYIYSGVVKLYELDIIIEVYEAAVWLGVNYLDGEYSRFLCNNLSVNSVFKIFTSACTQKDEMLQKEALKFLSQNKNIGNETLKKLGLEKLDVSTEVEESLKKLKLHS